ncbi:IQ and AAA domain-containing protein 1-like [Elgaria multicarinata webbii]|uniref:IQ and AAA domain-containing protein 1-like n=1 Tax=Elgaria multicarinata webbii TaxID=159646 RepID=UPI002FCD54DE
MPAHLAAPCRYGVAAAALPPGIQARCFRPPAFPRRRCRGFLARPVRPRTLSNSPCTQATAFSAHSAYGKLWQESRLTLKDLLAQELPSQQAKPERSRPVFYHTVATLFLRYVQTAQRLEACYDQVVHPQKRVVLRRLLDGVLGRILELKQELVELDISEYHYMDHVLQELKLTPADMEVPIPKYFLSERAKVLQERQEVLAGLLTRVEPSKAMTPPRALMPREEAVRLIQMAERMRQGRLRARFMWEIRRDEERERKVREGGIFEPNREMAAICIQKIWKGCVQRRLTKFLRQMEMEFIGMVRPQPSPPPCLGWVHPALPHAPLLPRQASAPLALNRTCPGLLQLEHGGGGGVAGSSWLHRRRWRRVSGPGAQRRFRSWSRSGRQWMSGGRDKVGPGRSGRSSRKGLGSRPRGADTQGASPISSRGQAPPPCVTAEASWEAWATSERAARPEAPPPARHTRPPDPGTGRSRRGSPDGPQLCPAHVPGQAGVDSTRHGPARFLGQELEPHMTGPSPAMIRAQLGEELRRMRQADYEAEYRGALDNIRDTLYEVEGPSMREELKEQLRQWFIECHDLTGRFPDYPEEEIGGCAVLFAQKTPEEEEEEGLMLSPSNFLAAINEGFLQYTGCWNDWDEVINFEQHYEPELIKAEKRKEVEVEIRLQVDELMREELQHLRLAVDLEETKAAKPHKGKKSGKKKGKKGKKEKDLTPERTIDSLYEELVLQGIIRKPQKVQLTEYSGDYCYLGTILRQQDIEPIPSTLDVRQNIALYAILRLGSQSVHELAPLVKSLLLAGPAGTGKKMLVHAVCTETGANLFDLSPDNLAGKYPGKSGLQMMVHLVLKVARLLQPSVIWVGNAEKTFYKKVPREEKEFDPRRLKKDLPKALNLLKAEDRVLLMGTSSKPYLADVKGLCKTYERILLVPRPDYASRYVTWQRLIQKHGGVVTGNLDLSALAKVSDGYSQGSMAQAVKALLSERRLLQLRKKPLNANELLQMLARENPIYPEEEEMLKEWYNKTPLGKRKLKEEEEKLKAAEAKDKKKKKKK